MEFCVLIGKTQGIDWCHFHDDQMENIEISICSSAVFLLFYLIYQQSELSSVGWCVQ